MLAARAAPGWTFGGVRRIRVALDLQDIEPDPRRSWLHFNGRHMSPPPERLVASTFMSGATFRAKVPAYSPS